MIWVYPNGTSLGNAMPAFNVHSDGKVATFTNNTLGFWLLKAGRGQAVSFVCVPENPRTAK
jgi:hypothetical protein